MWVTCYTDASFRPRFGGGWAVWLRCSEGRIVQNGVCPPYVKDANAAELAAIFAGVFLARREWPATTGVLVCSDSIAALQCCALDAPLRKNPALRRLQERLRHIVTGVELRTKWVKGHLPVSTGTQAWLNNRCDALAKQRRPRTRARKNAREAAP